MGGGDLCIPNTPDPTLTHLLTHPYHSDPPRAKSNIYARLQHSKPTLVASLALHPSPMRPAALYFPYPLIPSNANLFSFGKY